ncbi:MAG TPA: fumarylacetoacetate hydrolase family protein [Candidatus Dormibacteraeota bacterium]|nr:fumarylacetoacetate hydrolase family protein [Candidatus Dormibacteraeota bacterium]
MRIARVFGRLSLLVGGGAVDVETASHGRFPSDPDDVMSRWDELSDWAAGYRGGEVVPYAPADVGAPLLRPAQVFGIGLNYRDHAAESRVAVPTAPAVFTKFRTCLTGPYDTVRLPSAAVDWEVELVVVVGRRAENVAEEHAWSHVAGVTVGQDLSERAVQMIGPVPQFSLGKSFPGFGPIGPAIVSSDELSDPDDLELACSVDGEVLQRGRTRDMVFSVPELVARISAVCPLLPGDIIFTGTPPGVGMARTPPRFLSGGTTLVSTIEGVGELRNPMVAT